MAKVATVAWFPRTYLNVFETFSNMDDLHLSLKDVDYSLDRLSFTIDDYKEYDSIRFTQAWNGLHYFVTDLPDEGIEASADEFMKDMQFVLLEKILKSCHTVTYKNIVSDMMPLDFHTIVFTKAAAALDGYELRQAGAVKVAYKPRDIYYGGTVSYILGAEDTGLLNVLLYYAYAEVGHDFVYNMMKAMIRLTHEAEASLEAMDDAKDMNAFSGQLSSMNEIVSESGTRQGKMRYMQMDHKLIEEEYRGLALSQQEKAVAEALRIDDAFKRLRCDGEYLAITWEHVMVRRLRDIRHSMEMMARLRHEGKKGGWL